VLHRFKVVAPFSIHSAAPVALLWRSALHRLPRNCRPAVPEARFIVSHFPDNYSLCISFHSTYWRSSRTVEPFTHCI
jgi:hypothetical protein